MKKSIKTLLLLGVAGFLLSFNSDFCDGFAKGYVRGYCYMEDYCTPPMVPMCPMAPVGKDNYEGGFDIGFEQGREDNP